MWRWAILETDCLETLRESSVKSVALVFVCLRVCAPTYILPVCLSLRYDLLSCFHSCVRCRKLIHMLPAATPLCPSTHSKSNPPSLSTPLHIFCHSNMTPPLSFIVLRFLLNSLSTCTRMKDGFV